jgi:hypothetical protein
MSYRGAELFEQHITAELRRCRPFIEGALCYCGGTHEWDDIVYLVRRRLAQFWPGERAALVTEVINTPCQRYLNIWLVGGELEEILAIEPHIINFAREQGCTRVIANGRKGWERVLAPLDYRPVYVAYEKDLSHG